MRLCGAGDIGWEVRGGPPPMLSSGRRGSPWGTCVLSPRARFLLHSRAPFKTTASLSLKLEGKPNRLRSVVLGAPTAAEDQGRARDLSRGRAFSSSGIPRGLAHHGTFGSRKAVSPSTAITSSGLASFGKTNRQRERRNRSTVPKRYGVLNHKHRG